MISYRGKWALVTGASAGIGMAFARSLASKGANLILTARREDRLAALAQEVRAAHGIRTEVIACDLSVPDAPQKLFDAVQSLGLLVNVLVNNAGFGVYGALQETSLEQNRKLILLNVHALSSLTQLFLPQMQKAGEGYIFNLASTAAFQPLAYMSNYGASKAFVLSFSEALWAENRKTGVRVLAVCPGATETEFFDVLKASVPLMDKKDTAQNVVDKALLAMERDKSYVICGLKNYLLAQSVRFAPRALAARMAEMMLRQRKK